MKPWLERRNQLGVYDALLSELRLEEEEEYKNYLRMTPGCFNELLELVKEDITKKPTNMRDAISPKLKLAVTLRFLSTGESFASLQFQFRTHRSTISQFIPVVCEVIYSSLKLFYLKVSFFIFDITYTSSCFAK